ncbi:MAG: hypothetical protein HYX60_07415 [Legionella longbeachae]|nr:hypothetical protein [Legionella longbeachae]
MKQTLTTLLTILLLPLTALVSIGFQALLLSMMAVISPVLVFGGALIGAGKLSNILMDKFYPQKKIFSNSMIASVITSLTTTAVFFFLLIAPVAVGILAASTLISFLFVPSMAVCSAYKIAENAINKSFAGIGLDDKEILIKPRSIKLSQNPEKNREAKDVPYFDLLFKKNLSNLKERKKQEYENDFKVY